MSNSIAAKIAKIIAKADSTTSEQEADAFMAKAHSMMEAHGLSLLDLGRLDSDDPMGHDEAVYTSSDNWKNKIAFKLAKYYGCEVITVPYGKTRRTYTVFGRQSARITFTLMFPFVVKQLAALAVREHKAGRYPSRIIAKNTLASALALRLQRLTDTARDKHEPAVGNALVPVDMIAQAIAKVFGDDITPARYRHSIDQNAMYKANSISLNRQTPAAAGAKQIGKS